MPYIGKSPVGGGFHKLDALTASATATYALTLGSAAYYPETANQLLVSLNGVIQAPQDSFTVSGSNLIFNTALTASDTIDFVVALGDVLGVQGVTDGTVTTNKIANGAVTSAKLDTNIDITGNLTVDTSTLKVDSTNNRVGINNASPTTALEVDSDGATTAIFDRATDDGDVLEIRSSGTTMGSIGTTGTNTYIVFRTEANGDGCGLRGSGSLTGAVIPVDGDGSPVDDHIYFGAASTRWDSIYATNSTIQTSDQNEKQQIAAMTDAEITAAKSISALFKTFKWNSAVEAKGDAARTHAGVIAQDVEAAMTAAGLDAGNYAFFISDTWTNDDGNSQTLKGIRYPELLAFVGAATEQRLANIETRVTALEAN